jgi:hypothetical protein
MNDVMRMAKSPYQLVVTDDAKAYEAFDKKKRIRAEAPSGQMPRIAAQV